MQRNTLRGSLSPLPWRVGGRIAWSLLNQAPAAGRHFHVGSWYDGGWRPFCLARDRWGWNLDRLPLSRPDSPGSAPFQHSRRCRALATLAGKLITGFSGRQQTPLTLLDTSARTEGR